MATARVVEQGDFDAVEQAPLLELNLKFLGSTEIAPPAPSLEWILGSGHSCATPVGSARADPLLLIKRTVVSTCIAALLAPERRGGS